MSKGPEDIIDRYSDSTAAVPLVGDDFDKYTEAKRDRIASTSEASAVRQVDFDLAQRGAVQRVLDIVTGREVHPNVSEVVVNDARKEAERDSRWIDNMVEQGKAKDATEAIRIHDFMYGELDYKSPEQIAALKAAVDKHDAENGTTELSGALKKAAMSMVIDRVGRPDKNIIDAVVGAGILTNEDVDEVISEDEE